MVCALLLACCGNPKTQRQARFANDLLPAKLLPTPTGTEVKKAKVRVYADDEHRAQTVNWERKFSVMLRRANEVLGPTAGLELEIVETKAWPRTSASSDLEAMLAELEDLDPGGDVHFVVGVATALPEVTASMHQLGVARLLGKHLVVRGLNDTKEIEVLGAVLDNLSTENREKLWSIRRKHKETALFLHELGHLLGAIHTNEPGRLLHPTYDAKIVDFARANAKLMRIAAGFRTSAGPTGDRRAELEALRAYLAATTYAGWVKEDHLLLDAMIQERLASGGATKTELGALSDAVRPADRKSYRDAMKLADRGRILEAWEKAEPLFEFYPDEPAIQVLRCRLASARKMAPAQVAALCEKAAALAPADVAPTIKVAMSAARANDRSTAFEALAKARERLLSIEQTDDVKAAWEEMADAYRHLGLIMLAADAAGRSGGAAEIAKWARSKAARYAVPPLGSPLRAKLPAGADADYITAVTEVLRKVYARDYPGAAQAAKAAKARFGDQPGVDAALCDMAVRQRRYGQAKSLCKRAIRRFDGAGWAHYLYGLLMKRDKKSAAAIKHLARAVELGLDHKHPYQVLAQLYEKAGKTAELEALRQLHAKRFGAPL